jgi:cytochrome c oxidase subunit 4
VGAGLALLVLTIVTVAVRYVDLGEFNMPLAIGIALVKATIVALIFMHLRWDRPFNLLVLVGSILFVLLLIAFASMDVHQYEPTLFDGNAPDAQATLDANAPGAPVAQVKPTQGGAAN